MKKYAVCLLCLLVLVSCEPAGVDVLNKLIHHYDEMFQIVKENRSDPKTAREKLILYEQENKEEYLELIQELNKFSFDKIENKRFEEKLLEFTKKNKELIQEALSLGVETAF
jgi:hypothetical protein